MTITKQQFQAYKKVQLSGVTNMMDVRTVGILSGLSKKEVMEIITRYDELSEKYN